MARYVGVVKKSDLEGGIWELHVEGGEVYQLVGGGEALRVQGLRVELEGTVDRGAFGIGMTSPYLRVASWTKR